MNDTSQRLAAAALAALGVASAVPIPVAGLDFAGILDVFNIDGGDTPRGVTVAVVGASMATIAVLIVACVGIVLTATGSRAARQVLLTAAIAGFATAVFAWLPTAVLLGAAAHLVDKKAAPNANRLEPGSDTHTHRHHDSVNTG
jgi:hypothetical protein